MPGLSETPADRSGEGFANSAFLLKLADAIGSRASVSGDLDLDGRVDVILAKDPGNKGQKLHIHRNRIETKNRWIGVQSRKEGDGLSPAGASVTVRTAERALVGCLVIAETLEGQHPTGLQCGLAGSEQVESIEVQWVGVVARAIGNPLGDRYHLVLGRFLSEIAEARS